MKRKILWLILSTLIVVSMVFTACGQEATPTPTVKTPTLPSSSPTQAASGDWWDEFGEPEYGGTLTIRTGQLDSIGYDPATAVWGHTLYYTEALFTYDWTLDRDTWAFNMGFTPEEYWVGWLAESWEWTGPQTITVKIKDNITFQDKAPVNGRGVTADDIQYSYDRMLATGNGFTEPNAFVAGNMPNIERVVAVDTYTVEFQMKSSGAMGVYEVLTTAYSCPTIAREWVEQGDTENWENAVGTGPWLVGDFDRGISATYSKNPNYWGIDPRHPDKEVPYLDAVKEVAIADMTTAMAAMRTGKIDMIVDPRNGLSLAQAQTFAENDPDIQLGYMPSVGPNLDLRCDTEPFTDINVRRAMNMAINREAIAETFYYGLVDGRAAGVASSIAYKGWITDYEDWPADVKEGYSFDQDGARTLLADAGYPDGFETNAVASTTSELDILQAIKSYFMDVGIDMEIQTIDQATYMSYGSAGKHDQMVYNSNTSMMFNPTQIIAFRGSYSTRDNYTYNDDAYYDSLIADFSSVTEMSEAKDIFKEADLYLLEQYWSVQVCGSVAPMAWQPYIRGYSGELMGSAEQRGCYGARMWIDQAMKESMY